MFKVGDKAKMLTSTVSIQDRNPEIEKKRERTQKMSKAIWSVLANDMIIYM